MFENNYSVIETFREICRKTICYSLGESAGEAVLFFLQRDLGRDPFDVLWEDPRAVYFALERILGAGVRVLISLIVEGVNRECGLKMSPERFLELMRNSNQSSIEEIRSFIKKAAESHKRKGGGANEQQG